MINIELNTTPHAIVMGSGSPVAICIGKAVAEDYAAKSYLKGTYTIRSATPSDVTFICTEGGIDKEELIERAMSTNS